MFKCPICESTGYTLKYEIKSNLEKIPEGLTRSKKINAKIIACSNCGLEANEKIIHDFDFSKLYKKDSIYSKSDTYKATEEYPTYSKDIIDLISSLHSSEHTILEIGAFTGNLLSKLKEITNNCEGVELDPNAVSIAKEKKLNIHCGEIYDHKFDGEKYNIILGIGLLEHIQKPVKFLKRLRESLEEDGFIILQYPNRKSLNALISKNTKHSWDMYSEPGHIFFYDRYNIEKLLDICDLKLHKFYTATILTRGKIPILPYRWGRLEIKIKIFIQKNKILLIVYKKLMQILDVFKIGDTSLVVIKVKK